jgi:pimeloyl-ACP methyl ester carboxylesterase
MGRGSRRAVGRTSPTTSGSAASSSLLPSGPAKQGDVEELREASDELKGLGLTEIVDHYESQIQALDEPPVLIGHSYGGLIVELLLDRGLGRAGVAMSPAPPKGILVLPFSSLKAGAPETGQIFDEAGFANFHLHPPTEVHFKSGDRPPLLIVGADKDHTIPASLAHKQFEKYQKSQAQTDYFEFAAGCTS